MKKILVFFLTIYVFTFKAYAVTENELQDIADCMAAFSISQANFEINGDYKNSKNGELFFKKTFDVFYKKLSDYKKEKPQVDSVYLGQMPNRAVAKYGNMGDLQQLKYSSSVMQINNCVQYIQ